MASTRKELLANIDAIQCAYKAIQAVFDDDASLWIIQWKENNQGNVLSNKFMEDHLQFLTASPYYYLLQTMQLQLNDLNAQLVKLDATHLKSSSLMNHKTRTNANTDTAQIATQSTTKQLTQQH